MVTLKEKTESIEKKQRDHNRNEDLDDAIETADEKLTDYNQELSDLSGKLKNLHHRSEVLTEVFEQEEVPSVDTVRENILQIAETNPEDLVDSLNKGGLDSQKKTARDLKRSTDDAIDDCIDKLDEIKKDWETRTSTAESISQITGDDGVSAGLIEDIRQFVRFNCRKRSSSVGELDNEWKGLKARWQKTQVNWESFQSQHNLSDETITILKKLADDESVSLDSTKSETVAELFEVAALRENLKLSI